jgi:hypothetical protein
MEERISRRLQGDIGERSALCWLVERGAKVYLPSVIALTLTWSPTSAVS